MFGLVQSWKPGDGTRDGFADRVTGTLLFQVLAAAFGIVNTAIIARVLGPHGMGLVALALLIPAVLELLVGGGIGLANVYLAGSRRFPLSQLVSSSVAFTIAGSAAAAIILFLLAVTGLLELGIPGIDVPIALLALATVPAGLLNSYLAGLVQGLQRVRTVSAIGAAQALFIVIGTIFFVGMLDLRLTGVLVAVIAAGLLTSIAFVAILRREGATFGVAVRAGVVRESLSFGLRGQAGNVLQFLNYRLDLFILNLLLGPSGVGVYSVAVRLAETLWYLPNAVGFVIFPRAAATPASSMGRFTPRVFRTTLGLTALGAVVLALVGRLVIATLFSDRFADAFTPLLVLLPGVVALGGAKVLTNEIAGRGYPQYNSINAGVALIVTVVLDLLLIPAYGVTGAAAASSAAYVLVLLGALMFHRRLRSAQPESTRVGADGRVTVSPRSVQAT